MVKAVQIGFLALAALIATPAGARGDAEMGEAKSFACIACHGQEGERHIAGSPGMPKIAGMDARRIEQSLKAYRAGDRYHPLMQVLLWTMSDEDIGDLAAYYSGLK
jgi:cytochrome c553